MMAKKQRDVVHIPNAPNEADLQNRLLANQLRAMPEPMTICISRLGPVHMPGDESDEAEVAPPHYEIEHKPSPLAVVSWEVPGVPEASECTWFCDACETEHTDEQRNGQCCPNCGRHLEPAAERPRLLVAVRPCARCGVVYLDKRRV